jgi:TBC1 domain family member 2
LGYYSPNQEFWESSISRKREEYIECSRTHFPNLAYSEDMNECNSISEDMSAYEVESYKQIIIDVKRTFPGEAFSSKLAKDMLTRTLFVWAFKHPASGYVQGINDLAATFIYVFIAEVVDNIKRKADCRKSENIDLKHNAYDILLEDMALINEEEIMNIEADTFGCLENFLENLQENYTDNQPGVHKIISKVDQIVTKKDNELMEFLEFVDYVPEKFVYRWVNNILSREFTVQQLIMIWDKILAEDQGISTFLAYVCAALLLKLSPEIKKFSERPEEVILFIQDLPTSKWDSQDIKMLMAESYQLQ